MENSSFLMEGKQEDDRRGGEKFLVAMDLGLERMEKLCTISTLCHHLKRDLPNLRDLTSIASSRTSKKIRAHLGVDAHDLLVQLVECQKVEKAEKHENPANNVVGRKGAKGSTSKNELVSKLKENDAKRRFLLQIMSKAKAYFASLERAPSHEKEGGLKISVVSLLREALNSKYKTHVRRCFKELDVESLTSILFLMCPTSKGGSGDHSERLDSRPTFLSSSIEDIEESIDEELELESYYFEQGPLSETSPSSVFCEEVEEQVESLHSDGIFSEVTTETENEEKQENLMVQKVNTIKHQIIMTNEYTKALATSAWVNDEITVFQEIGGHGVEMLMRKQDNANKLQDSESILRISQILYKLLANIHLSTNFLNEEEINRELRSNRGIQGLKTLLKYLWDLREITVSLFSPAPNGNAGESSNTITKLAISHSLVRIEEDRLQSKVYKAMTKLNQRIKALDDTLQEWTMRVKQTKDKSESAIRSSVKNQVIDCTESKKGFQSEMTETEEQLKTQETSLGATIQFVKQSTKSLRARRHYLEASLDSLIRQYDSTMLKYQANIDELSVEEIGNSREIDKLQNRFKDIEEKYDEMRATKRLKELLKNMEKAESIKQNWAARKIQMAWRRYKVAKLRKRKLKGRKKGKKKTPPPPDKEKGLSPSKTITSSSRSRSKSQTP